ncbi:hypothetical protein C5S35_14695 [Candidatus Methanophagaceae archaeon]|nr:hypothetical protein C5S35_14695 [Methanophagales archaeon]
MNANGKDEEHILDVGRARVDCYVLCGFKPTCRTGDDQQLLADCGISRETDD